MMTWLTILLLAISLSMDVTAVSVTLGICKGNVTMREALRAGMYFGFFHAAMPTIGFFAGSTLSALISPLDHWLAFGLLAFIGIKMIVEAITEQNVDHDECPQGNNVLSSRNLTLVAIATSVDALAAGISIALDALPLAGSVFTIGLVSCCFSVLAILLGKRLGVVLQRRATVIGGAVLILIGLRMLLDNLNF